jgi:predicted GNAT family acetyltransferase
MRTEVSDNREASRYELTVDGELVGVADYYLAGTLLVFPRTEIAHEFRGQGLGAVLVQAALDAARASGHQVVPRCWYVAEFVAEHPEYEDLVAQ